MTHTPAFPIVWTEIPVTDMDAARRFYEPVFGWEMTLNTEGPNDMLVFPYDDKSGVAGHLYPGTPAKGGSTTHLVIPDKLEDAISRVWDAGGTVLEIPPVEMPFGRFAYALDPDGNSIGLFEPAAKAA
ncbi:VOC family protein [uncultured Jannaschia sp.]|uniref:VOC family protein n=1 Tax=uncultured Jannaschia sp. TaxID=293347 RepID=UPI002611445E|nr:VOC family protein [uncultured Jannaschia sp.]